MYCGKCYSYNLNIVKLNKKHKFDYNEKCKNCGIQQKNPNFARVCKNCKKQMVHCMNCLTCTNKHTLTKVVDVKSWGNGNPYSLNKYYCYICGANRPVRPYAFGCKPCRFLICPDHAFKVTGELKSDFTTELDPKASYLPDPFWERFEEEAKELGLQCAVMKAAVKNDVANCDVYGEVKEAGEVKEEMGEKNVGDAVMNLDDLFSESESDVSMGGLFD